MRPFGKSWRWASSHVDMGALFFNGLLLLGFVVAMMPDTLVLGSPSPFQSNPDTKKCKIDRYKGILAAICSKMEKTMIPLNLKTDIEMLHFTQNRLRELTNDSLARLESLKFIYLRDNFIQNIEEGTFSNQQYLEVLDLAQNGCDTLPKSLFQLPNLRMLILSHNKFTNSAFNMKVTSPIQILDLDKNKLTKIPFIGIQPSLVKLNVTGNLITSVTSEDLAPYCALETLDLSRNMIEFNDCECQALNQWVKLRRIFMQPELFRCSPMMDKECTNVQFSNRTYELYNECSAVIQHKVETEAARSMWILIVSVASVSVFLVFVMLYCVHNRNRKRRKKQKEQQQLAANNANTELLNSNLTIGNS